MMIDPLDKIKNDIVSSIRVGVMFSTIGNDLIRCDIRWHQQRVDNVCVYRGVKCEVDVMANLYELDKATLIHSVHAVQKLESLHTHLPDQHESHDKVYDRLTAKYMESIDINELLHRAIQIRDYNE